MNLDEAWYALRGKIRIGPNHTFRLVDAVAASPAEHTAVGVLIKEAGMNYDVNLPDYNAPLYDENGNLEVTLRAASFTFVDDKEVAQPPYPDHWRDKEHPTEVISEVGKKYSRYHKRCPYDFIDIYRVLELYNVTDQAVGHAIKKLLVPGDREGGKTLRDDIREARDSLTRRLEMWDEDDLYNNPLEGE